MIPKECSDICAIITTYRPDNAFPSRVQRASRQVGMVVIVDDGDCDENKALLQGWFEYIPGVILHHNRGNIGVAASLNVGITIAKKNGYRWILTLDDDTSIYPDMVIVLIEAWQNAINRGGRSTAIMGMLTADEGSEIFDCPLGGSPLLVEKRGIITSGSLMSLDVYEDIGGFREEFFIDAVDYDYCLRARDRGYCIIMVYRVGMVHQLGNSKRHKFGPFTVVTTNHDPLRRYYAIRNSTVLMREHIKGDPLYSLAVMYFNLKTLMFVLLYERDKHDKLIFMGRGLVDAFRNRLGKYNCRRSGEHKTLEHS